MSKICPKCQTVNVDEAKFCKKCGFTLQTTTEVHKPSNPTELSDIAQRVQEEKLYEQVITDLANGKRKEGLYAKALVDASGSEEYTKALYIKYALQAIKDEMTLQSEQEQTVRQKQLDEQREQQRKELELIQQQEEDLAIQKAKLEFEKIKEKDKQREKISFPLLGIAIFTVIILSLINYFQNG